MRWLNYQHLFYFYNVAKFGSVTEASYQLRLAQPTISAQIKSLEDVIGEKLFLREGRSLKLSEAGQLVMKYAESIFHLGNELLHVLDGQATSPNKVLNLGISDVVPKTVTFRVIEPILGKNQINCFEDKTEKLLADLALGTIDLVLSDRPISPNFKVRAFNHFLGESSLSFLAVPKLAKALRKNFPKSLHDAPLLMPTSEASIFNDLYRWFADINIEPRIVGTFQDRALSKIVAGAGFGIIPVPNVVEKEVMNEFDLELVGRTKEIKEQFYLISLDRKIKNPIVVGLIKKVHSQLFS